jgi:hypothetical protein
MNVRGLRGALTSLALAGAFIVTAAAAQAAPTISLEIASVGPYDVYSLNDVETTPIAGTPEFGLSGIGYGTAFNCEWSITVNPDPSITSTFTLTNISPSTQTFIMTITLPIAAIGPTTVQGGYYGDPVAGTVYTDSSRDGEVTLATVGVNPFYEALVNGVRSQALGSFSETASGSPTTPPTPPMFGPITPDTWGTPIPSAAFGPASGNIRIRWEFSLTPGDSVSTKGFFQVEAVPEPTSLLLIGLGLAGLVVARKRA